MSSYVDGSKSLFSLCYYINRLCIFGEKKKTIKKTKNICRRNSFRVCLYFLRQLVFSLSFSEVKSFLSPIWRHTKNFSLSPSLLVICLPILSPYASICLSLAVCHSNERLPSRLGLQNTGTASLNPHPAQQVSWYNTNQSNGEVPVMLELWVMRSIPLQPSLQDPLRPGVVAPDRVLSMGQIELNWTFLTFKLRTYAKIFEIKLFLDRKKDPHPTPKNISKIWYYTATKGEVPVLKILRLRTTSTLPLEYAHSIPGSKEGSQPKKKKKEIYIYIYIYIYI